MSRVVCFGELMVRLSAEGYLRFPQADKFMVSYTGAEGNVALALSNFGISTKMVTKLPDNEIAHNAVRQLKAYGVDETSIVFGGDRIGVYYIEKGASQRPSKIIFDRKHSSIAEASIEDFNWDEIFCDAEWFHFTGITPALSGNCAEICLAACKAAKKKGIAISCDLNYRKSLWSREDAQRVMIPIMEYVDVLFANEDDCSDALGVSIEENDTQSGRLNKEGYAELASQLQVRFNLKKIAITLRESISASENGWSSILCDGEKVYESKKYLIRIVDRVGGGDSFASGMIYALINGYDSQTAVNFAVAASCLKHTIEYDYNLVSVDEVISLMEGNGSGRVQR